MTNEIKKSNQSERILLTAFECISSRGYANVSLRDIADEAGVVLSQLNYYYKNKEGLFIEVIKMMIQKYLHEVADHLKNGTTPKEKLSDLIKYFRETLEKNPKMFRLLYDFTSMALWSPSFNNVLRSLFEDISNLIEKHVLNNASIKINFRGYTPNSIARMLFGAMIGTALQIIIDPQGKKLPESLNAIELVFE